MMKWYYLVYISDSVPYCSCNLKVLFFNLKKDFWLIVTLICMAIYLTAAFFYVQTGLFMIKKEKIDHQEALKWNKSIFEEFSINISY